jgi:predicted metal-dependent phosphoesterase TrpH
MIVDLHAHTYCSDGSLSPAELLTLAAANHVDLFSITDHDTTAAYAQLDVSNFHGQVVPGVEISCQLDGSELHVVGLGIDLQNDHLQTFLAENRQRRKQRAQWIIERLVHLGYEDITEPLSGQLRGEVVCRTHLAKSLVEAGVAKDFAAAFKNFLGRQGKVWRRAGWPELHDTIDIIHRAGGLAILAHPTKYRFSAGRLGRIIAQFSDVGGDGIELNYSGLSLNHKAWLKRLALEHNLSASVGCDFHHPGQTWAMPGRFSRIADELTPVWHQLAL